MVALLAEQHHIGDIERCFQVNDARLPDLPPGPGMLLDEIDAHLDAFHVSKLGELLVEESEKSQFIVVTLKPEMVNKAQKVYGVYMRNGSSNVISAKLPEVMA